MKTLFRTLASFLPILSIALSSPAHAQKSVTEPKKIKSAKALKPNEGAVRLSVRAQMQGTETLFVYFIAIDANGQDGDTIYRFERGAGVPIAGSNMIDQKPIVYRMPAGRYRPLAFTISCQGVPFEGAVCGNSLGSALPTGYYRSSSPLIDIKSGALTEAGDFIVEYTGTFTDPQIGRSSFGKNPLDYALRWRPLPAQEGEAFSGLEQINVSEVSDAFKSRVTCDKRPPGVSLYIPFEC
jgi:hypothetical protein